MIKIIEEVAGEETMNSISEDLNGYVKVVVDIEKEILTAGGTMHIQGKELLLKNGSNQENLWGGGLDLDTNQIDYDSMINIRPKQNNTSREVLDHNIRQKMETIIRNLLR